MSYGEFRTKPVPLRNVLFLHGFHFAENPDFIGRTATGQSKSRKKIAELRDMPFAPSIPPPPRLAGG
jgi:hypothetical protein